MQPGTTTCGRPSRPMRAQPLGAADVEAADQLVGQLVGREVDDADEQPVGRELLHRRPADAVRMEDDAVEALARQRVADRHHRLGRVAEHRDRDARPIVGRAAGGGRARSMPAIAAATLSKIVVLIGLSPRMSTTEWTTITSRVPTSGPNRRWPEAIGVTMILGMPIGSDSHGAGAEHRALGAAERTARRRAGRRGYRSSASRCSPAACRARPRRGCRPGAAPRWSCRRAAPPRRATRRARCRAARRGCRSRRRSSPGRAPAGGRGRRRSPGPWCRGCRSGDGSQESEAAGIGARRVHDPPTTCASAASCSSRRRARCRTRPTACCCRGPR